MLLSLWGHIRSIPTVGAQTEQSEHNSHPQRFHAVCRGKQENAAAKRNGPSCRPSPDALAPNSYKSVSL